MPNTDHQSQARPHHGRHLLRLISASWRDAQATEVVPSRSNAAIESPLSGVKHAMHSPATPSHAKKPRADSESTSPSLLESFDRIKLKGKDVMIGWGLEIRREQVASMVNPDLSAATFPPPSFQGTRRNAAAYAEAQIPVKPDWDVIAAIRSDHYNDVGPSHNGKLATRWKINSRWALRSSIGTGFRAPSIGQVQVVAEPFRNGQTNLKACT